MSQIEKPEISVITITRNRDKVLPRAISSVLCQTFTNFEYIIVNGASFDTTAMIIEDFARTDNRIRHIAQSENMNIIESLALAFKISRGNYIAFLDDDDEYLPEKLEKQLNLIKTLPAEYGFVYCWYSVYDDKTEKLLYKIQDTDRGNAIMDVIDNPTLGGTPSLFFKREAFKKLGGWSSKIKLPSDWEMRARAAAMYYVDFVAEVLVKVHINHEYERQSKQSAKNTLKDKLNLIEFHEHFLNEFDEYFNKLPKKKLYHLFPLIRGTMAIGQYSKSIKYALLALKIDKSQLIKITKCLLFGLINPVR